jgi:hypothetical protein
MSYRRQMQNAICGAAQRHIHGEGVIKGFFGHYIARTNILFHKLHYSRSRFSCERDPVAENGGDGAVMKELSGKNLLELDLITVTGRTVKENIEGAQNLNTALQAALNPTGVTLDRGGRTYRVNDKVMQIRNNYDKDVFNGDIGRIRRIDYENQEVRVDFDGRAVKYEFSELDELVLAYAISIHKAQGSEYPAVIFPILTQHFMMLQRNLLYTAVTRAKKLVVVVGSKKALAIAIRNNKMQERFTLLRERLAGEL